jgi:hypothetical protein
MVISPVTVCGVGVNVVGAVTYNWPAAVAVAKPPPVAANVPSPLKKVVPVAPVPKLATGITPLMLAAPKFVNAEPFKAGKVPVVASLATVMALSAILAVVTLASLILAVITASVAIVVALPVLVTSPVRLALVVTVAALPVTLPAIGAVTVKVASVPTDVKVDPTTAAGKEVPVNVVASAGTVILALPSKATPLIVLVAASLVAVAALPVVLWFKVGKVLVTAVRSLLVKASVLVAVTPPKPARV